MLASWKESCYKSRQLIKKQRHHFAKKGQSYIFSVSHAQMNMGDEEGWAPKNWCFQTVVLEKTLENPLDSKNIKAVSLKGNQSWIFIGRADAKAEAPLLWSLDLKRRFTGKDPDAGKNWRRKVKGAAEDEIIRYHHWLNGREFEQILGDSGGQRSLVCYSPLGSQKSDMTQWLNNNSYHCNHCSDHIHPRDWDL